jgi:hypothetical protein
LSFFVWSLHCLSFFAWSLYCLSFFVRRTDNTMSRQCREEKGQKNKQWSTKPYTGN